MKDIQNPETTKKVIDSIQGENQVVSKTPTKAEIEYEKKIANTKPDYVKYMPRFIQRDNKMIIKVSKVVKLNGVVKRELCAQFNNGKQVAGYMTIGELKKEGLDLVTIAKDHGMNLAGKATNAKSLFQN